MLAASYWSLLAPAIELAQASPLYGASLAWLPVAIGVAAGAAFIVACDRALRRYGVAELDDALRDYALQRVEGGAGASGSGSASDGESDDGGDGPVAGSERWARDGDSVASRVRRRARGEQQSALQQQEQHGDADKEARLAKQRRAVRRQHDEWRRVLLLVLAVTVHNFPEGLAVGVGFGSAGPRGSPASFAAARNLAIGIALQNFPEGLAVSMPLYRHGEPLWRCVFYGQLSGMVEPLGGLLGAWAVSHVEVTT